ncbi:hypothetical protein RvY_09152 [Ramazzottius varieornatus]|uniref:Pre-rRNA-processing protein TSR1 homolog n=1 Tax=Ramazzottius varieornatus TaxID=947166 RepID=A0A1D1V8G6_RAMVA|nr:hypothetical protein RvY_09152 [Ramazzottius varieornatus]
MSSSHHRSGVWVQKNKTHKNGQHKSKGELRTEQKGRTVQGGQFRKGKKSIVTKNDRRNRRSQRRALNQLLTLQEKQKFESTPLDVTIVSTSPLINVQNFLDLFRDFEEHEDIEMSEDCNKPDKSIHKVSMKFPRWKISLNFRVADMNDLWNTLDLAKIADLVIFLYDPFEEVSAETEDLLSSLLGQGLPAVVHCLYIELEKDQNAQVFLKEKSEVKKNVIKRIKAWFPDPHVDFVSGNADMSSFLFRLSTVRPASVEYREMRPYMISTAVERVNPEDQSQSGSVRISGIVKGGTLDVNGVVHVLGYGDFLLSEVIIHERADNQKGKRQKDAVSAGDRTLTANPADQPSLKPEEEIEMEDSATNSQLDAASVAMSKKRLMKTVPKGTSNYQAAWIVDDDEKEVEDDGAEVNTESDEEDVDMNKEQMEADGNSLEDNDTVSEVEKNSEMDLEQIDMSEDADGYDSRLKEQDEAAAYAQMKKRLQDRMFPDEIDTPLDTPARIRFFKYRGLDDFRSANWDAEENLPREYAQVSRFSNMKSSKKAALNFANRTAVEPFNTATVVLRDAPLSMADTTSSLVVYGLLLHEHSMTVVNMSVKRISGFEAPVRSGQELVFQVGFRRFKAKALFSELSAGKLHKFLRFMPEEEHFVISVYAPITFPPAPVLVYKDSEAGKVELIAKGSVLSLDPSRVVLKRVVLSGHPFKINVRSAVIRFMFFNTEDVNWFRKVKLTTKNGRVGEIKEPLGTHGHMKCRFDGQLQSSDTVLMKLYKRVFPKWTYTPLENGK